MRIKRTWSEFKAIVTAKTLQIFEGDKRADYYHLVAIDGPVTYESMVQKNGLSDQVDFEANYLPTITNRISQEPDWDDFVTTFPSSVTELHTYKKNTVVVAAIIGWLQLEYQSRRTPWSFQQEYIPSHLMSSEFRVLGSELRTAFP
jgi:hypothetical protein